MENWADKRYMDREYSAWDLSVNASVNWLDNFFFGILLFLYLWDGVFPSPKSGRGLGDDMMSVWSEVLMRYLWHFNSDAALDLKLLVNTRNVFHIKLDMFWDFLRTCSKIWTKQCVSKTFPKHSVNSKPFPSLENII